MCSSRHGRRYEASQNEGDAGLVGPHQWIAHRYQSQEDHLGLYHWDLDLHHHAQHHHLHWQPQDQPPHQNHAPQNHAHVLQELRHLNHDTRQEH